jgi:heme exporter protein D
MLIDSREDGFRTMNSRKDFMSTARRGPSAFARRRRQGIVLKGLFVWVWLALGFTVAPAIAHAVAPNVVTASFDVLRNGMHVAVIDERFEARDGRYHIVSETTPVGLLALVQRRPLRLESSGRVTGRGLQPERFEGARGADDPRRASAEFEWAAARLSLSHDGRNETLELPAGTQDRLSIMYQFMFFSYDRRRQLDFPITNGRKLDRYHYTITPGVEIATPLGRMKTLHLVRQREAGGSGNEVWLAPQHGYLPVKMLIIERNGTRYEQMITKLEVKRQGERSPDGTK